MRCGQAFTSSTGRRLEHRERACRGLPRDHRAEKRVLDNLIPRPLLSAASLDHADQPRGQRRERSHSENASKTMTRRCRELDPHRDDEQGDRDSDESRSGTARRRRRTDGPDADDRPSDYDETGERQQLDCPGGGERSARVAHTGEKQEKTKDKIAAQRELGDGLQHLSLGPSGPRRPRRPAGSRRGHRPS